MERTGWVALAVALTTVLPGGVLASHMLTGNPEQVVTGHTVLASNIFLMRDPPTDFAALAGLAFVQRRNECVVWFSGIVIFDGSLGPTGEDAKSDSADGTGAQANDNALDPCGKIADRFLVMAVEAGDCDPRLARNATFVRDLSFVDPNAQAHPVAEIRYECAASGDPTGAAACLQERVNRDDNSLDDDLDNDGDEIEGFDPGGDDNNSVENVFTASCGEFEAHPELGALASLLGGQPSWPEYAWVTEPHLTLIDPTLDDGVCLSPVEAGEEHVDDDLDLVDELLGEPDGGDGVGSEGFGEDDGDVDGAETFCAYNFALLVDTCNDHPDPPDRRSRCLDGGGAEFLQEDDDGDGDPTNDAEDALFVGARFDDTSRWTVVHGGACPTDHDDVRDGRSGDVPGPGCDPDNHREDHTAEEDTSTTPSTPCYPPQTGVADCGTAFETDDDPIEDHLAAQVDLVVSLEGCTGLDADGDGVDDGARTLVGAEFCRARNEGALSAAALNHPGCVSTPADDNADSDPYNTDPHPGDAFPEDSLPGVPVGNCWDIFGPPDDVEGRAGGNGSPLGGLFE